MLNGQSGSMGVMGRYPMAFFAKKNDKPLDQTSDEKTPAVPKKRITKKSATQPEEKSEAEAKTEESIATPKLKASRSKKEFNASVGKEEAKKNAAPTPELHKLYTLKFNSPILPFAKFPLTQNKYIQDFLRKYEEDKDHVQRIIGVHFLNNNNSQAQEAIGIEIEISKKNNITVVESNTPRRFRIKSYDETTNFCLAEDFEDQMSVAQQ